MDLDNLLSRSAMLEQRIESLFALPMPTDSARVRAVPSIASTRAGTPQDKPLHFSPETFSDAAVTQGNRR